MSGQTLEPMKEFWYRFDNETLWQRTPAVQDAMSRAYFNAGLTFDSVMEALRVSFSAPGHPEHFLSVVGSGQDGFLDLASLQLAIMDEELGSEAAPAWRSVGG